MVVERKLDFDDVLQCLSYLFVTPLENHSEGMIFITIL